MLDRDTDRCLNVSCAFFSSGKWDLEKVHWRKRDLGRGMVVMAARGQEMGMGKAEQEEG